MLMLILGVIDIIVAGLLWASTGGAMTGNSLVMMIGVLWLLKGLYSILAAAANKFFFDFLGVFDLLSGIFLLLSFYGSSWGFLFYLAIVMLLKGLYSAATDFVTTFLRGQ